MRKLLLLVFWLFLLNFAEAQEIPLKGDLKGSPAILVNKKYTFSRSPSGFGSLKEFKINAGRSNEIFKEERNSAWFLIDIPYSGTLTFDLSPHFIKDDYDWMLYKYSSGLDKNIRNESAKPLRTNNARNAISHASRTGMGNDANSNFMKPGPGNNYSLPAMVKKGDKLALIVDNIYGGKGFDLHLILKPNFETPFVTIEGFVRDKVSLQPLGAKVTVEDDSTGVFIGRTSSDSIKGRYTIKVPINRPLNITAEHPSYIFSTMDTLLVSNSTINFLLDPPVSGNPLVLNNIHFLPNKDEILPASIPELDRLSEFLKNNPLWTAKITGHTNPNVFASAKYLQQLSFNRAIAVKNYLIKHAIAERRISCAGLGGKSPVVVTRDASEGMKNLRVEVTLTKD